MARFPNVALICQTIASELMIDENEVVDVEYRYHAPTGTEAERKTEDDGTVMQRVRFYGRGLSWSEWCATDAIDDYALTRSS